MTERIITRCEGCPGGKQCMLHGVSSARNPDEFEKAIEKANKRPLVRQRIARLLFSRVSEYSPQEGNILTVVNSVNAECSEFGRSGQGAGSVDLGEHKYTIDLNTLNTGAEQSRDYRRKTWYQKLRRQGNK